jgi:hypothetical protein
VPHEWCVVVRPAETASAAQRQRLKELLRRGRDEFEWQAEGTDTFALVPAREELERVEGELIRLLSRNRLASAVVTPFPIGRWYERLGRYVVPTTTWVASDPVLEPDEIGWLVSVRPASAFDWRAARVALAERGRTTIRESDGGFEVGARDEVDARALIAELNIVPAVGSAEAQQLGWFRRWRMRQQLLGNYAGIDDPAMPH